MTQSIRLDVDAPIALSVDMWAAIPALVEQATADPNVKILIIHGGDAGAFAAGADISEFEEIYATRDSAAASGSTIAAALDAVEACPKPTLAAIEGACVGGGVSLAMTCDLRVASAGRRGDCSKRLVRARPRIFSLPVGSSRLRKPRAWA